MSDRIWKLPLRDFVNDIEVPRGAEALSVGLQDDEPVVWIACDPETPWRDRHRFLLVFTGQAPAIDHASLRKCDFLGTLQKRNGLVLHAFALGAIDYDTRVF